MVSNDANRERNWGVPTCHIHPKVETLRSCTRCGRPACPACLHDAAVGAHCTTCVKEQRGPLKDNVAKGVKVNVRRAKGGVLDLPITKTIIMVNVAIFIMTEFVSKQSTSVVSQGNLGLNPIFINEGEWWRLFTSGFLHFSLIHIGFNMYILFRLGETFEKALGPWRYIALYTTCLLGGAAGAVVLDPMNGLTGGASGAVFGLAGAAVVALRQRGVSFNNSQWGPLLLVNLVLTFTLNGVSKGGHVGGLLFGVVAGAIIMHPKRRGKSLPQDIAIMAALMAIAIIVSYAVAHSRVSSLVGGLS